MRVAIQGLPLDSAAHRAAKGHTWQQVEYLLADLVDINAATLELLRATNDSDDNTFHLPEPLSRPCMSTPEEKAARDRELAKKHARDIAKRMADLQPLLDQLLPGRG